MTDRPWWKDAVVYQVYPRSFNDSNGDGVGDIPGILEKLPYLADLGVDAVWLNPVYESPMADGGYDVADYRSIHPDFGTMADWERLRDALHDRDMRLIMDLVVNHTSTAHEWFQRSRRGESPYDEFYYWRESDDGPPNNWESFFGGSAWSYDDMREAYYLHLFDERQPDLNWRTPAVREAVYDVMRFWLDRDVDGFRMDVINLLSKREGLPDGAPNDYQVGLEHFLDGPRLEEYLAEMDDRVLSAYPDVVAIGEMPGVSATRAAEVIGVDDLGFSMLIQFEHVMADWGSDGRWDPVPLDLAAFTDALVRWQTTLAADGWNCLYLNNHDQPRAVSRFGDDEHYRRESATMLATLLLTLRGTPFIYQGQEIGMTNASFPDPDAIRDVEARNFVETALEADPSASYTDVRPVVEARSRDNSRTPMQWTDAPHAGFTAPDATPWLPVTDNHPTINVATARADSDSIWHYYRRLIELRHQREVLVAGAFELIEVDPVSVFAYRRTLADETVVVVCSFTENRPTVEFPRGLVDHADSDDPKLSAASVLVSNYEPPSALTTSLELRSYEAAVYELP